MDPKLAWKALNQSINMHGVQFCKETIKTFDEKVVPNMSFEDHAIKFIVSSEDIGKLEVMDVLNSLIPSCIGVVAGIVVDLYYEGKSDGYYVYKLRKCEEI